MPDKLTGENAEVIESVKKEIVSMAGNIEKLNTSAMKNFEDFKIEQKKVNDGIVTDFAKREEIDKIQTEFLEKVTVMEKMAKDHKTQIENIEVALNRSDVSTETSEGKARLVADAEYHAKSIIALSGQPDSRRNDRPPVDTKAFETFEKGWDNYFRWNEKSMTPDQVKALMTSGDDTGGYLVKPTIDREIVKIVHETTPMRQYATVKRIGTDSIEFLGKIDRPGAQWVGETETRAETTTPTYKKYNIPVHDLNAEPRMTQRFLDDVVAMPEAQLIADVAEEFSISENTAYVTGNGEGKPRGLLTYAAGTTWGQVEQVNTGATTGLIYAGVMNIIAALKEAYHVRAIWMMKRASIAQAMQVADGDSSFVFAPMLFQGERSPLTMTIMGYPIRFGDDMPIIGSNNLSYIFGDLGRGYWIVDRQGIRVLRDPYTAKPFVIFSTTKRTGGAVVNFEAFKIAKCAT